MTINVARCRNRRVPQRPRDRHDVHTLVDKERCEQMSETVQAIEWKIVLFTELTKPEIRCAVLHRFTVPFSIEPVGLNPLVSEFKRLLVLFCLVLFQHIHDFLRKFESSLRLTGFSGVGINAFLRSIIARSADADDVVLEVHIFPFQSQHLTTAETAVDHQVEECAVLQGLIVQQRKKFLHLFVRIDLI